MFPERPHWMRPGATRDEPAQPGVNRQDTAQAMSRFPGWSRVPPPLRLFAAIMALLVVWYAVIGTVLAGIAVDLAIRPNAEQLEPGGSVTIGMSARLIEHQVVERSFTPNDPIFYPTGLARRTPAFQSSVMHMIADVVAALDQDGQGGADVGGLAAASRYLATKPETWWLRAGWPPVGWTAERQYRRALDALSAHNRTISASSRQPVTTRSLQPASRAALHALLRRLETEASDGNALLRNDRAGNRSVQLSSARGTAFAAAMLMRGIRDDNAGAVRLSGRAARWGEALDALDAAAGMNPVFVGNADLVQSGYHLLLAGNAVRDILGGQG